MAAFLVILLLGWAIWRTSSRRLVVWTSRGLATGFSAALIAAAFIVFINSVNIGLVRADTYYKQGQAYDGVGQWQGARRLRLRPMRITTTSSWAVRPWNKPK